MDLVVYLLVSILCSKDCFHHFLLGDGFREVNDGGDLFQPEGVLHAWSCFVHSKHFFPFFHYFLPLGMLASVCCWDMDQGMLRELVDLLLDILWSNFHCWVTFVLRNVDSGLFPFYEVEPLEQFVQVSLNLHLLLAIDEKNWIGLNFHLLGKGAFGEHMGKGNGVSEVCSQGSEEWGDLLFVSKVNDLRSSRERVLKFIEILDSPELDRESLHQWHCEIK